MFVLPATGWSGLAGTGFPMGKPDLPGRQGDSRESRDEELGKKGKTKSEGSKRKLGGAEGSSCSSLPLTEASEPWPLCYLQGSVSWVWF